MGEQGEGIVAQARDLIQRGHYQEATDLLEPWLSDKPDDADGWAALGAAHFGLADWAEAEKAVREVVRLRPDSAREWCNLGVVLRKEGRVEEARDAQVRTLALDPRHQRASIELEKLEKLNSPKEEDPVPRGRERNMANTKAHCPKCGAEVYGSDEYCLECGAHLSGRLAQRTGQAHQPSEDKAEVTADSGTVSQQTMSVNVQQQTPWWILAVIFGGPVGCLFLVAVLPVGLLLMVYFAPLVLAGAVALWIWYKLPGKPAHRMRMVWITLAIGMALTVFLWLLIFGVNYMALSSDAS